MKKSFWISLALLAIAGATTSTHSQETRSPVVIGEEVSIHSTLLGEQRSIVISTPRGYEQGNAAYPVLYMLDGRPHFHYVTGVIEFLSANQFIPQMIVVAINNTDRNRDLTPPSQNAGEIQRSPTHGGAANFQRFIAEELMPWMEQNYRVHPYGILVGHSLGGLFAINTMINDPQLFDAYIAISPSLQWSDHQFVAQAENFFAETEELPLSLYISAGNEGRELLGGIHKLVGALDSKSPEQFQWKFEHMPLESHNSVPLRSLYQGLEYVFSSWSLRNPYETYTNFGLDAVQEFHNKGNERYGFDRGFPISVFATLLGELVYRGDIDGAVAVMDRLAESANPPASTIEFLANALRDERRRDEAIRFYRDALRKNPESANARQTLDDWDVDYSDIFSP